MRGLGKLAGARGRECDDESQRQPQNRTELSLSADKYEDSPAYMILGVCPVWPEARTQSVSWEEGG